MAPRITLWAAAAGSAAALLALAPVQVAAQEDVVLWHNRYHAVLAMAAYADNVDEICPLEEFTVAKLLQNFPQRTSGPLSVPWEILDRWGPTEHGSKGFTVMIPEMDKVVIVFTGNYWMEKNLPTETASLDVLGLAEECPGCRVNSFALQGYLEAKAATNNFEKGMQRWRDTGLWWSTTGHGLGGMHSLISALDMGGSRNVSKFIHAYGNPRTMNPAAAQYYNHIYGGDMTEQAYGNGDIFANQIPASDEYAHVNTAFWYHGWDDTYKMHHEVCYEAPEDPRCKPQGELNEEDHYFLFTNVGNCGSTARQRPQMARDFIAGQGPNPGTVPNGHLALSSAPAGTAFPTGDPSAAASTTADVSASTTATAGNATVTMDAIAAILNNGSVPETNPVSFIPSSAATSATLALDRGASSAAGAVATAGAGAANKATSSQDQIAAANAGATGTSGAGRNAVMAGSSLVLGFAAVFAAFL